MTSKPLKAKKCRVCPTMFTPRTGTQVVCSWMCSIEYTRQQKAKREAKDKQADRKATRERLKEIEPLPKLRKRAQTVFNAFIRARDDGLPCISCGRLHVEYTVGGQWDCGHFLSVGSHPELRFNEDNANRQCKSCNAGSGKYARKERTVAQNYEINLIQRIGQEAVDRLRGPHAANHYTREDYQRIIAEYRCKLKTLLLEKEKAA